jgi:hypothetical protein
MVIQIACNQFLSGFGCTCTDGYFLDVTNSPSNMYLFHPECFLCESVTDDTDPANPVAIERRVTEDKLYCLACQGGNCECGAS